MSIGAPAMGYEESIGIAKESSYGTANATPSFWMRPISCTLKQVDVPVPLRGPTGVGVDTLYNATIPRHYRAHKMVAGNLLFEAEYDDIGWFLMSAFEQGAFTLNTNINGGASAGTNLHAFEVIADTVAQNTPPSLTITRINGMEDLRYTGCMVDNLEIAGRPDQLVTVSLDIIGQAGGDLENADADTEGYSAAPFMEFHDSDFRYHATVGTAYTALTSQTGGTAALDWLFRLENRLRAVPATGLTERTIREPIYSGYRQATLRVTRDFFDDNFFEHMFPPTQPTGANEALSYAAASVHLESDEAAGAHFYGLDIYSPCWLVMGEPTEYSGGAGIIPESILLKAAAQTASTAPCTVRLANTTATGGYSS
jgi:hypothetical protein